MLTKSKEMADIPQYYLEIQPILDGEYEAIYCYPGGECVHHISEIKAYFEVIEQ